MNALSKATLLPWAPEKTGEARPHPRRVPPHCRATAGMVALARLAAAVAGRRAQLFSAAGVMFAAVLVMQLGFRWPCSTARAAENMVSCSDEPLPPRLRLTCAVRASGAAGSRRPCRSASRNPLAERRTGRVAHQMIGWWRPARSTVGWMPRTRAAAIDAVGFDTRGEIRRYRRLLPSGLP
jgi:hypothetical protein